MTDGIKAGMNLLIELRGGNVVFRPLERVSTAWCEPDPIDPNQLPVKCPAMLRVVGVGQLGNNINLLANGSETGISFP